MSRPFFIAFFCLCAVYVVMSKPTPSRLLPTPSRLYGELGGLSGTKAADNATFVLVNKIKASFEKKTGQTYSIFTPVEYKDQVVAGMNYYVKVQIGLTTTSYAHIKIHETLPVYGSRVSIDAYELDLERYSDIVPI